MRWEHQGLLLEIPPGPIRRILKSHLTQNNENKQLTQISKEGSLSTDGSSISPILPINSLFFSF